ncbi:MAG TPA: hypothetical protein VN611_09635 [Patescibacteria group bacterium]|nr:hypothetical protein [Patescibacteria group bacterium]
MLFAFKSLTPKDNEMLIFLQENMHALEESAILLVDGINQPLDAAVKLKQNEKLESIVRDGGEKILAELRNTFIAPLDREDIYRISCKLCDIAESQRGVLERIVTSSIQTVEAEDKILAGHILQSTQIFCRVISELPKLKKHADKIDDMCLKIVAVAKNAQTLYRQSIGNILCQDLSGESLKRQDLLMQMEKVQGLYANVAILLRGVVMKYV